jgi:primosomal protein N' (replication factor Y)
LKAYGFGTEKLEHELEELFPDARITRMDTDITRRKGQAFKILKKFGDHEIDILVGTQMITKGYDFPMVTLVGVIAADLSLGFPDFRAGERTFQILSQVAGRAGRGSQRGKVIIQTFNPDHYAISTATAHDYQLFFEKEKELREQLGYPPFSRLTCLRLDGNNKEKTAEAAHDLSLKIRAILSKWPKRGKEIQVLGPAEAPISRIKGKYRWQILVKSKNASLLQHLLNEIERLSKKLLRSSGVHLILDVDPYQMI